MSFFFFVFCIYVGERSPRERCMLYHRNASRTTNVIHCGIVQKYNTRITRDQRNVNLSYTYLIIQEYRDTPFLTKRKRYVGTYHRTVKEYSPG